MKNISDNTHTGIVSLWYEFWCDTSSKIVVKNISDNTHSGMVSLGVSPDVRVQVRLFLNKITNFFQKNS